MRQFERYPVHADVAFSALQNPTYALDGKGLLRNASLLGGYIDTQKIISPHTWIQVRINHDRLGTLRTMARVLRPDQGGFALHFAWTDVGGLQRFRDTLIGSGDKSPGSPSASPGKFPEASAASTGREESIDSLLRKSWASLVEKAPDSFLNTVIGWWHNTFSLDQEPESPETGTPYYISQCPAMLELHKKVDTFAPTSLPILLNGETGTGKEVFARLLHMKSQQAAGPFIPVNCGAIPLELAESILFGHEKGSFTGAHSQQKGYLESAEGGTLFLDEIGELPLPLQVKFLRVLQERAFTRVGSNREIPLSCRIVAATNKNLREEVKGGRFREDLYYRLDGVTLSIPPLRERREDLIPLARFLAKKISRKMGLIPKPLSGETEEMIRTHPWRGNVREMENAIHRATVVSRHIEILPEDIGVGLSPAAKRGAGPQSLKDLRDHHERDILSSCLLRHSGNVGKVADELGISRPSVYNMIKRHQLEGLSL